MNGITIEQAVKATKQLKGLGLRFFPAEPSSVALIADNLTKFVNSADSLAWLIDHVVKNETEWPTIAGLRNIYKRKHRPLDYNSAD